MDSGQRRRQYIAPHYSIIPADTNHHSDASQHVGVKRGRPLTVEPLSDSTTSPTDADVDVFYVALQRKKEGKRWGFLIVSQRFPLEVDTIHATQLHLLHGAELHHHMQDMHMRPEVVNTSNPVLRVGDRIFSINGQHPQSYAEALKLLHDAGTVLLLEVGRRTTPQTSPSVDEVPMVAASSPTDLTSATPPPPPCGPTSSSLSTSAQPLVAQGPEGTPRSSLPHPLRPSQQLLQNAATRPCEKSKVEREWLEEAQRCHQATEAHTNLRDARWLRQECKRAAHTTPSPSSSPSQVDELRTSSSSEVQKLLAAAWSAEKQGAIYDRHHCPFSREDGFTDALHEELQSLLTGLALNPSLRGGASRMGNSQQLAPPSTSREAVMRPSFLDPTSLSIKTVVEAAQASFLPRSIAAQDKLEMCAKAAEERRHDLNKFCIYSQKKTMTKRQRRQAGRQDHVL